MEALTDGMKHIRYDVCQLIFQRIVYPKGDKARILCIVRFIDSYCLHRRDLLMLTCQSKFSVSLPQSLSPQCSDRALINMPFIPLSAYNNCYG